MTLDLDTLSPEGLSDETVTVVAELLNSLANQWDSQDFSTSNSTRLTLHKSQPARIQRVAYICDVRNGKYRGPSMNTNNIAGHASYQRGDKSLAIDAVVNRRQTPAHVDHQIIQKKEKITAFIQRAIRGLALATVGALLVESNTLADTMTMAWPSGGIAGWLNLNIEWWDCGQSSGKGPTPAPSYNGQTLTINMDCDRNGQSSLAQKFNESLYLGGPSGSYNHGGTIAYYQTFYTGADNPSFDMNPGALNWVIGGTLQVGPDTYKVVIGQGHSSAYDRNNWWIGGQDLTGFAGSAGVLTTTDGKYIFSLGSDDHSFQISQYPYPATNWMSALPDAIPLSGISIPGTHDSGTYAYPPQALLTTVVTQYQSIRSQLSVGVRSLDIRLSSSLQIVHGATSMDLYLKDVLDQAFEFLQSHPRETIVMTFLQQQGSSIDSNLLYDVMYNRPYAQYWTTNSMPTLGDARGKIVVVNRKGSLTDQSGNAIGVVIDNWPNNTTDTTDSGGDTPVFFAIQDHYSNPGYQTKADDVSDFINDYVNNPSYAGYWFFNYLSCTDSYYTLTEIDSKVTTTVLPTFQSPASGVSSFGTTVFDFAGVSWVLNNGPVMGGDYWEYAFEIANDVINENFKESIPDANVSFTSSGVGVVPSGVGTEAFPKLEAVSTVEGARKSRDRYTLRIDLAYDKSEFDLVKNLTDKSCIHLRLGSYEFNRCLGDGTRVKFFDGKKGRVIHDPDKETTLIKWGRRKLSIIITSHQKGHGMNILDMTGQSGSVSGELDFFVRLHKTSLSKKVSFHGSVTPKTDDISGTTTYTWKASQLAGEQ